MSSWNQRGRGGNSGNGGNSGGYDNHDRHTPYGYTGNIMQSLGNLNGSRVAQRVNENTLEELRQVLSPDAAAKAATTTARAAATTSLPFDLASLFTGAAAGLSTPSI